MDATSYSIKLSEKKYMNWVKASLGLLITKEGITPFVRDEMKQFQQKCLSDIRNNNGLPAGTTCSDCCTENFLRCPTKGMCHVRKGQCSLHRNYSTRYIPSGCPGQICNDFKNVIQKKHRYHCPSYRNTDAKQWCSNSWEVAKCFMPPDGYNDVQSAAETDFNGINSVIINLKDFQSKIHADLSQPNNIFEQGREVGRVVRHSPNLEVEDTDLLNLFIVLQNILSDPRYLAADTDAKNAHQKLSQLLNDTLFIGKDDVRNVLDDADEEAKKQNPELIKITEDTLKEIKEGRQISMSDLDTTLKSAVDKIEEQTKESGRQVQTEANKQLKRTAEKGDTVAKKAKMVHAVKRAEEIYNRRKQDSGNIREVLEMLGLQSYIPVFEAQKISIEEVEIMTDSDFEKLGIDAIGVRLKIKKACRNFLKGNPPNSPVVQKYLSLNSREPKKKGLRIKDAWRNFHTEKVVTDTSQTELGRERQDPSLNDNDIDILQTVNTATESANRLPTNVAKNVPSPDPEVSFNPRALRLSLRRQEEDAGLTTPSTSGSSSTRTRVNEPFEMMDSEDEELQRALLESSDPNECNEPSVVVNLEADTITTNLSDDDKLVSGCAHILKTFQQETVLEEQTTKILVMRNDILNTAFKALKRKSVNLRGRLYVKFAGEIGEDAGGPRREFFRLVMKAMQQSSLFEGPECSRVFSHDIASLENGSYRLMGNLVALSLAQDGPGVHFLSPVLFDIMTGKNIHHLPEDSLPEEAKDMIKQLREAQEHSDVDVFLHSHGDKLLDIGISNAYILARKDKEELIELLKKYYMSYRISGEISQFTRGMNEVNRAWDMITSHADVFKHVFCYKPNDIKDGEEFLKLCKVNYSEPGSNSRALEDRSMYGFEVFLQSIEDGDVDVTFSDLLVFITGASHVPPCGFDSLIEIEFYTDKGRLPSASTCALRLWMPRVEEADEISAAMYRALKESYGFMKV